MDIKHLLGMVQRGEQFIKADGDELADLQAFQLAVATAAEAFDAGYISHFDTRKESRTGFRLVRIVQVGKITESGEAFLANA